MSILHKQDIIKGIGDVVTQIANKKIIIKMNVQIVDIKDAANVIHLVKNLMEIAENPLFKE